MAPSPTVRPTNILPSRHAVLSALPSSRRTNPAVMPCCQLCRHPAGQPFRRGVLSTLSSSRPASSFVIPCCQLCRHQFGQSCRHAVMSALPSFSRPPHRQLCCRIALSFLPEQPPDRTDGRSGRNALLRRRSSHRPAGPDVKLFRHLCRHTVLSALQSCPALMYAFLWSLRSCRYVLPAVHLCPACPSFDPCRNMVTAYRRFCSTCFLSCVLPPGHPARPSPSPAVVPGSSTPSHSAGTISPIQFSRSWLPSCRERISPPGFWSLVRPEVRTCSLVLFVWSSRPNVSLSAFRLQTASVTLSAAPLFCLPCRSSHVLLPFSLVRYVCPAVLHVLLPCRLLVLSCILPYHPSCFRRVLSVMSCRRAIFLPAYHAVLPAPRPCLPVRRADPAYRLAIPFPCVRKSCQRCRPARPVRHARHAVHPALSVMRCPSCRPASPRWTHCNC